MSDIILERFITGSKGGKGGGAPPHVAQESPNTLQSKATLKVIEILCEGQVEGLTDGLKSVYLDGTPVQNADDSFNFQGITMVERIGTPDQEHIPGFSDVTQEEPVGVKVTVPAPIVRTVNDADTDAVRVTIRIPALTEQNTSNGDLGGSSVSFKIEYQPNGGSYITAFEDTISGKCVAPYEQQYRIDLTGSHPWNIRVTRITPDSEAISIQNDIYWSSYTRIIDHKLIYPDTALVGLAIDSSLFGGTIPTRSYRGRWKNDIKIPSNYDPETREYTGVWDGTFITAWTNNPAWIWHDLLVNNRYGLGERVDPSLADKWTLYEIGQYCDEMVDDGMGGMEPRFTFNGVLQTQEDAWKVMQAIAASFRAISYWGAEGDSATITLSQDAPKDPVKIFNNANVIGGIFDYSGTSLDARHTAAFVSWNNPEDSNKLTPEVVEDQDLIRQFGYRDTDVALIGCTSRGQAARMGRWLIYTDCLESEMVNFSVGLADADTRPGNIVQIHDRHYAGLRTGGRVVELITSGSPELVTGITIDDPIVIEPDNLYTLAIVLSDSALAVRELNNAAGETLDLTFEDPLDINPIKGAVWALTITSLAPRLFRVLAVRERSPVQFDVTALIFDPTKFDRVENGLNIPPLNFTKLATGVLQPPTNLSFAEYIVQNGALIYSAVALAWQASADPRITRYELEAKTPSSGGNYQLVISTNGLTHDITGTVDGTWSFRVRGFDALGNPTAYETLENVTLSINGTAPDDVTGFSITSMPDTSTLLWKAVKSLNLSHYELRYSTALVGATWNSSIVVVESIPPNATSVNVASRTGTFLIKAVSNPTPAYPSGVYSDNAALISTDIDFLLTFNFIEDLIEHPGFSGNKDNVVIGDSGNLELVPIFDMASPPGFIAYEASGIYDFSDIIDLGAVYTNRVTPSLLASGNLRTNIVDEWENVDDVVNVDGVTDGLWKIEIQISTTNDDPLGSPPGWSEWQTITVGDYNFRAARFRALLFSLFPTVTPSIEQLAVSVDMPDLIQGGNDLVSGTSVYSVEFDFVFRSPNPKLAIATQDMATGDYYVITNKTAAGFDIQFFDASDVSISRTFDYVAKGYGVVIN